MLTREIKVTHGKIFLGHIPEKWHYTPSRYLTHEMEAKRLMQHPRVAGAELYIKSGRWRYGVLGCSFTPDATGLLKLKVGILDIDDCSEPFCKGLVYFLANAVIDEAQRTLQEHNFLGSGTLEVNHALWDMEQSNPRVFMELARSTVLLLNPDLETINEVEASELVKTTYKTIEESLRQKNI